jgi:transglutaminase-like putative cysteine protease
MSPFLESSDIIDWQHRAVRSRARILVEGLSEPTEIARGLCYQRLSQNGQGPSYCLHGLNAVWLPEAGWYRIDARGNRAGNEAQFKPPVERLAYGANVSGEADLPEIWVKPLSVVVERLWSHTSTDSLSKNLPDVELFPRR